MRNACFGDVLGLVFLTDIDLIFVTSSERDDAITSIRNYFTDKFYCKIQLFYGVENLGFITASLPHPPGHSSDLSSPVIHQLFENLLQCKGLSYIYLSIDIDLSIHMCVCVRNMILSTREGENEYISNIDL